MIAGFVLRDLPQAGRLIVMPSKNGLVFNSGNRGGSDAYIAI
jgi:hypothetical protein